MPTVLQTRPDEPQKGRAGQESSRSSLGQRLPELQPQTGKNIVGSPEKRTQ